MQQQENIPILMADLSGYSALTETHGAVSAADLIDKYVAIVKDCLVGDSQLTERVGDEVMIISASADHLLSTAAMIIQKTSKEDNFLQVHGDLHYGEILRRNNSFFWSTINVTARITKKANPGTFWCSEDFMNALENKSLFNFQAKGRHTFKNISEEKEIAELVIERREDFFVDPVCNMLILNKEIATKHPESEEIYFCCHSCLDIYTANKRA
ncbi:MAG: adenylate/guanylate cyclase domain-containing protein [Bacteroidota bacterium]|nr:adenylate/guanylate cyclase domain-containing protein [Bacteroidota bacterium]